MNSIFKKALYFGIGAMSMTREKAEKFFNEMVEKGEMTREEAKQFIDEAIKKGEEERNEIRKMVQEEILNLKDELSVATKSEIAALEARIRELENKLQ
ncbi:polyhydroxyalkanoate synthesis regulator [Thermosyntropha sp.]|uniref:phasin family protein n=1 Tax=Thermosyntropha sp. TaxID=2740820 RepID=UPI0025F659FD|nr:polyhydroxyalkanoate synthesis regulator [Thermosyntropha sp.]MBO8158482.1 hypothetical protein [Thermosyntropha sp.]